LKKSPRRRPYSQELLLIKISLTADTLASAAGVLEEAGAQVLHTDVESLIAQITADTLCRRLYPKNQPYGILNRVALA
jgi:acetolactate synthase small subunit